MVAAGILQSAISALELSFNALVSGETGLILESSIGPNPNLVDALNIGLLPDASLLDSAVVLKLIGRLGTGMVLDKAKSHLVVKNGETFLALTMTR